MNYKTVYYIVFLSVIALFLMLSSKIVNGLLLLLYFGLLFVFSKAVRGKHSSILIMLLNFIVVLSLLYFKI